MNIWDHYVVSPHFTVQKLLSRLLTDKIDVFEDQMRGWIFDKARALLDFDDSGFAVLMLLSSYFEAVWSYVEGIESIGQSKSFFRRGLFSVFPAIEADLAGVAHNPSETAERVANTLYEQLRCGLFHAAILRNSITLMGLSRGITVTLAPPGEPRCIMLNPRSFLAAIECHFNSYVARLRDPADPARVNFEKLWDTRVTGPAPVPELSTPSQPTTISAGTAIRWGSRAGDS